MGKMSSDSIKKGGSMTEPGVGLDIAKIEEGQSFADVDKISEKSYGEQPPRNTIVERELIKPDSKSANWISIFYHFSHWWVP
jgi:hypothetical protein